MDMSLPEAAAQPGGQGPHWSYPRPGPGHLESSSATLLLTGAADRLT